VVSFEPAVGVVSKETRSPIPCPSAFLSSGRLKRQALKRANNNGHCFQAAIISGDCAVTESDYLKRLDAKGYLKVLEVLRKWDPIGVISDHNQDEYDCCAAPIVRMLDAGIGAGDLAKYMTKVGTEHMGLTVVDEGITRICAQELVNFWKEWKPA
jgi:hypothetical protein